MDLAHFRAWRGVVCAFIIFTFIVRVALAVVIAIAIVGILSEVLIERLGFRTWVILQEIVIFPAGGLVLKAIVGRVDS